MYFCIFNAKLQEKQEWAAAIPSIDALTNHLSFGWPHRALFKTGIRNQSDFKMAADRLSVFSERGQRWSVPAGRFQA